MRSLVATTSSNPLNALMFLIGDFLLGFIFWVVAVKCFILPKYIAACDAGLVNLLLFSSLFIPHSMVFWCPMIYYFGSCPHVMYYWDVLLSDFSCLVVIGNYHRLIIPEIFMKYSFKIVRLLMMLSSRLMMGLKDGVIFWLLIWKNY